MNIQPAAPIPRQSGRGSTDGKLASLTLRIGGMTCAHCPPTIEKALKAVLGVKAASVNLATQRAKVDYDPSLTILPNILRAIRSSGYSVGTATTRVPLKNMHCSSCVIRVELALKMTPGVVQARASLGPSAVDIEYQPDSTAPTSSVQCSGCCH